MSYDADKLKMGYFFYFDPEFDLEGQSWLPLKTIGTTLTKVFCIFG